MALPPKLCPECEEEYLHTASVCVHCDVPLVLSTDLERERPAELPPSAELHCIRVATPAWALGLSERLEQAGVPHRVEAMTPQERAARRGPTGAVCGVYVLGEDAARAAEIDAGYLQTQLPDLAGGGAAEPLAEDSCPACGEPLDAVAPECPGCGIAFGSGE